MPLGNPGDVVRLLDHLRELGAQDQVSEVLHRNPAARASLDTPGTVIWLLRCRRQLGARIRPPRWRPCRRRDVPRQSGRRGQPAGSPTGARVPTTRSARSCTVTPPPRSVSLDSPSSWPSWLTAAGARCPGPGHHADQPRHPDLGRRSGQCDQHAGSPAEARAHDPASTLAARAATQMPLDDPYYYYTIRLLCQAGTKDQAAALAARIAIDNPLTVAHLLNSLGRKDPGPGHRAGHPRRRPDPPRQARRRCQIVGQPAAGRSPRPGHRAGHPRAPRPPSTSQTPSPIAGQPAAGRSRRPGHRLPPAPATHTALDKPDAVAVLLRSLREAGAQDQATMLATRAATHTALDDPIAVAVLFGSLWEAGAQDQATMLATRAATAHRPR